MWRYSTLKNVTVVSRSFSSFHNKNRRLWLHFDDEISNLPENSHARANDKVRSEYSCKTSCILTPFCRSG